jgi:WD40 repeat protein
LDTINLWDEVRGESICQIKVVKPTSLAFSQDGSRLWGISDEERANAWTLDNLAPAVTPWFNVAGRVMKGIAGLTCIHAGKRWILVGSGDGSGHLLRSSDGQEETSWAFSRYAVSCVALNQDESLAALGSKTGDLRVVRVSNGEVVADVESHHEFVTSVAFSPDGRWLAAGSKDKTARLYRITDASVEPVVTLHSPPGRPVVSVQFSPDGCWLGVLVSNEHGVRLWNLEKLRSGLSLLGLDYD